MILSSTASRFRAVNRVLLFGLFLWQPSFLQSAQHPFIFKGIAKLSNTYLFSILDSASGKSIWLRPREDVNGFSIVSFDPLGRVLTYQWKDVSGIMYLGSGSAGPHAQTLHEALSTTRIIFSDVVTGVDNLENLAEQPSIRLAGSSSSFAIGYGVPSTAPSVTVGPPQDISSGQVPITQEQPMPNADGEQALSLVELRNRIGVNRVNSRLHASDHIRDLEEKANL